MANSPMFLYNQLEDIIMSDINKTSEFSNQPPINKVLNPDGTIRNLMISDQNKSRQLGWWNNPDLAEEWAKKGGGIDEKDRDLVKESLVKSHFYDDLAPSSQIMDLGVGAQSYIDPSLIPAESNIYAVDISTEMLKKLRSANQDNNTPYKGFIAADATKLPFSDGQFNSILSSFMMRYLDRKDQLTAILEMVRTSKDGGWIHIIDFDHVDYPNQVNIFDPNNIYANTRSNEFQDRLKSLHKEIDIGIEDIKRDIGTKMYPLRHMTILTHSV